MDVKLMMMIRSDFIYNQKSDASYDITKGVMLHI